MLQSKLRIKQTKMRYSASQIFYKAERNYGEGLQRYLNLNVNCVKNIMRQFKNALFYASSVVYVRNGSSRNRDQFIDRLS